MSTIEKYKIAREFRIGCADCITNKALDSMGSSEAYKDGWEWAYRYLKPQVNDEVNKYIVSKGFKPFEQIEAMRNK
jgi:hypothetical protein